MMRPAVRRALMQSAAVVAVCAAAACGEPQHSRTSPVQPVIHPAAPIARLRGTVDVAAGTLSFEPIAVNGGLATTAGIDAAVYGQQGVTVSIYNSPVVVSAPSGGKKTYTANVGLRNRLAYRIGDEQGVGAPPDTMGIYVFVNTAPYVSGTSSPCTCSVTVNNAHGTLNFTGSNQSYWFWPEIVGAFGGGSDTTKARKQWVFQADTQVTRFNFDVLVSAAWAPPDQTVWKVTYPGDSLPDTQAEPRWRMTMVNGGPTESIVAGQLVINLKKTKDTLVFVRRDSISTGANALIEARFRLDDGGNSALPQPGLAIDDNVKYVGLFVSDSGAAGQARVGFVDATGSTFVPPSDTIVGVKNFRTYQLRKWGADSAVIYVDNARRVKISYTLLPPTKNALSGAPPYFLFGFTNGNVRTTQSTWAYSLYQIGQATP